MNQSKVLSISNLTEIHAEGNKPLTVLKDASLQVAAGEFEVLLAVVVRENQPCSISMPALTRQHPG